jgi:hypothetical protein
MIVARDSIGSGRLRLQLRLSGSTPRFVVALAKLAGLTGIAILPPHFTKGRLA